MKKSSLLTLTLASLVALVGCGKQEGAKKVNARKFDEAYANFLEKNADEEGYLTFEFHDIGTLSFKQTIKGSGSLIEEYFDEDEEPNQEYKGSFDFYTNPDTYEFEPVEVEGWEDEDYAAANSLLEECYLTGSYWILSSLFYSYIYGGGLGSMMTGYPEDPEEEFEYPENIIFTTSPYSIKFLTADTPYDDAVVDEETGEVLEPATYKGKYGGYEYLEYNKYGELVKYEYYFHDSMKGVSDKELNGKFEIKETITIKYGYSEPEELR